MLKKILASPVDWFILCIPIALVIIGIITIYTITYPDYHFKLALDQLIFASLGLVVMATLMFTNYRAFSSVAWLLYAGGIILLALLVPPLASKLPFIHTVYGSNRWINIGFFQLQPSEVFKFLGIIAASAYLARSYVLFGLKKAALYLLIIALPLIMVLVEPNLGTTAVLMVIFGAMFLAAKPPMRLVAIIAALIIVAIPIIFLNLKPYQRTRVDTFLNPQADPQGQGYNVRQALIAVGSGGLTGQGFGQGTQTVLNFLPVPHSDFIFAGFAEATGFLGAATLLVLYGVLLWRIIVVAQISEDPFGRFIAIGVAAKIFFQVVIHVGMNIGLLPVTGIPLPFMSYGGTAIIIDLA
ncbi:MAG TPA: FtsW/RodA/SpoVE family cell cycle protein, partial [Candidatus Saccharimonadales bacterium]|nr:FtsW/RodA/SpoVE family cell cycle protein [Candidatus Saccharimonadales bacterium]